MSGKVYEVSDTSAIPFHIYIVLFTYIAGVPALCPSTEGGGRQAVARSKLGLGIEYIAVGFYKLFYFYFCL